MLQQFPARIAAVVALYYHYHCYLLPVKELFAEFAALTVFRYIPSPGEAIEVRLRPQRP